MRHLPAFSMAVAVVGDALPDWARRPAFAAEAISMGAVEDGLNRVLARTRAPFLLPVQAGDRLDPAALLDLARALGGAPACYACAAGVTDQVRRDGTLRRTTAATLSGARAVLAAPRLPSPILFRTSALRQCGGWRPGEAEWQYRGRRHRALLARLLARGALLGCRHYLGVVERSPTDPAMNDMLGKLVYQTVTLTGPGLHVTGRIAAITPDMITLAPPNASLTLIPTSKITTAKRF